MYDAIVVGSRCAGAATARLLAQKGLSVLMVDRATFPSDTVSTHCIVPPGVAILQRWGLFERVRATNVPYCRTSGITIGEMEMRAPLPDDEAFPGSVSPRRTVLDKLLVDAAVEEGAHLREGVTVKELVTNDGRVTGIRGQAADGTALEERAAIVIGADGTQSFVARSVGAVEYDVRDDAKASGYYAYFSGTPADVPELAFNASHFGAVFPTNDGLACIATGRPDEEFGELKRDVDNGFYATLEKASPRLGAWAREGARETRWFAFSTVRGFFRQPFGPGWALVGDAGYHKDPVTGHGITDAFRDAELLAEAVAAGLGGSQPVDDALAGYQSTRDERSRQLYDATQDIAALQWDESSLLGIFMRYGAALQEEIALQLAITG